MEGLASLERVFLAGYGCPIFYIRRYYHSRCHVIKYRFKIVISIIVRDLHKSSQTFSLLKPYPSRRVLFGKEMIQVRGLGLSTSNKQKHSRHTGPTVTFDDP